MSYLVPSEFVTKMVDAGESKVHMSTRDTLIRAFMAGAILALAAVFAVTVAVQSGSFLLGAVLFPVGFCMLYLMGFDLLTGVFMLTPLALLDRRPGVSPSAILRNWGLVFVGNFAGALRLSSPTALTRSLEPSPKKLPALVKPVLSVMRNTARPAGLPSLSAACCATGWSPWGWSVP